MNTIVISDLHFKDKEPYMSAQKRFIEWFISSEYNKPDYDIIFLGDIFDKSHPNPATNQMVIDFFNNLRHKNRRIVSGNHDLDPIRKQSALDPLKEVDAIVYDKPTEIYDGKCLVLPYYYQSMVALPPMKEYYTILTENGFKKSYDYIFGHIEDDTVFYMNGIKGNGIKIDIEGQRVFGHIHHIDNDSYLNVPIITNEAEKGKTGEIMVIDFEESTCTKVKVPMFLDFKTINYPDDLPFDDTTIYYYIINGVPDSEIAYNYYTNKYKNKQLFFKSFNKEIVNVSITGDLNSDKSKSEYTTKDWLIMFNNEKKLKKGVFEKLSEVIQ